MKTDPAPGALETLNPFERQPGEPAALARPDPSAPFVLYPDLGDQTRRPRGFETLEGLARHIHAARAGAGIRLAPSRLWFRGHPHPCRAVTIHRQDPFGGGDAGIVGHACLQGAGVPILQAALYAACPNPLEAEAA